MECNILFLRHSQLSDNGFVLGVEDLDDLLEHFHPARYWLFGILEGKLDNQTTGQFTLILKSICVKLLFFRLVLCNRRCPDGQSSTHKIFAAFFQLGQSPLILLGNPSIHADTAIIKTVLHRFLFGKGAIAVLRVISRQRKVCHTMEP